jgi:hypothetical protein
LSQAKKWKVVDTPTSVVYCVRVFPWSKSIHEIGKRRKKDGQQQIKNSFKKL